jgi:hypothetical protein
MSRVSKTALEAIVNTLEPLADVLLFLVVPVALGHAFSCAIWPYKACRTCDGDGRITGPLGGIRLCRRCDGTGLRLRLGRRAWNAFRRLYRDIKNHR